MSRVLPILFNTQMVIAVLNKRKTVTRCIVKGIPEGTFRIDCVGERDWEAFYGICSSGMFLDMYNPIKAPYQPGDILYIRETWDNLPVNENGRYCGYDRYYYKADKDLRPEGWKGKWKPSIHMPKEAARIWLKVTDVRVERLQDISEDGVCAEGAEPLIQCPLEHATIELDGTTGDMCWNTDCCKQCDYINKSYGELFGEIVWNSTIKKSDLDRYGWDANPWVWVIEFERCEKPESDGII